MCSCCGMLARGLPFQKEGLTVKPWSIMCCGCFRVMSNDGTPIGEKASGPVDLSKLADHFKDIKGEAAFYQSKREADNWAKVYGWTAEHGNHRCPDCAVVEMETPYAGIIEKHGAYIDWREAE